MLYDILENVHAYEGIHPGVLRGLRYLAETDFSKLPDGRQDIDGDAIFASIQSYTTKPVNDKPEAHKDYIDIQFLIEGEECVGYAPLVEMAEEVEAHPDRDLYFYHGQFEQFPIGHGRFMVLWPGDAHAPGIAKDQPAPIRKCVVKVRVK